MECNRDNSTKNGLLGLLAFANFPFLAVIHNLFNSHNNTETKWKLSYIVSFLKVAGMFNSIKKINCLVWLFKFFHEINLYRNVNKTKESQRRYSSKMAVQAWTLKSKFLQI